jgi:ABC-2 type transport system ATP-binding protein
MPDIISIKRLTKSYNKVKAIDELNLSVKSGEFFGFLGPNGAGKTTTIRILTGVIVPDYGEATISGLSLNQKQQIAQIIGVIPESRGFYAWMTADEYLKYFCDIYKIKPAQQKETIESLLGKVGLQSNRDKPIGAYSRGMKQRLGLARALINNPRILFLDEPTLGLDPQGQEGINNLLKNLNKSGVTIFLSSHLLHEVSFLCDRIAILNKGKLVVEGTIDELRQKSKLTESFRIKIQGDIKLNDNAEFAGRIKQLKQQGIIIEFLFNGNITEANRLIGELQMKGAQIIEFLTEGDNLTDLFLNLTKN